MLRAVRLAVALLLACLGLVVTVSAPASADCTCKQGTLERQVARADAVFIGTVDNVEVADDDHTYDVTATRTYKGTPERSTQVFSAGGKNACGLGELRAGTNYVFLATGTAAPFEADSCSGHHGAQRHQGHEDREDPRRGHVRRAAPAPDGGADEARGLATGRLRAYGGSRCGGRAHRPARPRRRTPSRPALTAGEQRQRYMPPRAPSDSSPSLCGEVGMPAGICGCPAPAGRARRICSSCAREAICWA